METRHSNRRACSWSPYSSNNRRICLRRCSKENFEAVNISITSTSICEIPSSFERARPSNFLTQGSFIHLNSRKIFERDLLSSDTALQNLQRKNLGFSETHLLWKIDTCDHYSNMETKSYLGGLKNMLASMCLRSLRFTLCDAWLQVLTFHKQYW